MTKNIIIAILAIALIGVGVWGYTAEGNGFGLKNNVEDQYAHSFEVLNDTVRDIGTKLGKCAVSNDETFLAYTFAEISKQAAVAQDMLARLPVSQRASAEATTFLSRTEDFAAAMLKKHISGGSITAEDRKSTEALQASALAFDESIANFIEQTQDKENSSFSWASTASKADNFFAGAEENLFTKNLTSVDESMTDYPSMIYDGPFSDHLVNEKPRGLTGPVVTREEAEKKLREIENTNVKYVSEVNSKQIPSYYFEVTNGNETRYFYISKQGGHLISSSSSRAPTKTNLTLDQARVKAEEFLKKLGHGSMAPSYYETFYNIAVFNYCYLQDDVKVYSDLIKVQVSLEDGKIVGYEATGYFMNHHTREDSKASLSEAQAKAKVTSKLNVTATSLAIIPTKGKHEYLCWEFKGKIGEDIYIIYIDASTGSEREIFKVIEADNSVLVL